MDKIFMPSLNVTLPRLGFGCMRLAADYAGNIELQPALKLLHESLDKGVDYFDTAYVYHSGKAEAFLGKHFFSTLPRHRFMVATKLPVYKVKTPEQCSALFDEQKNNLCVDYIDFYLAHSLNRHNWQKFRDWGGAECLQRLRQEGQARFVGFSFHGQPEDLAGIMDDFPWDFVQLQINYYDWPPHTQDARLQYETAAARKMPLFVMEPVRGGSLANLPGPAAQVLLQAQDNMSQASWAMRWVGGLPEAHMILSGMNTPQQLADNLDVFTDFQPLSAAEQQTVEEVCRLLYAQPHVDCTGCDYCREACPQRLLIGGAFESYNDFLRLKDERILRNYMLFNPEDKQSLKCTACASCVPRCPQQLDIPRELAALNEKLTEIKERQRKQA